jgi:integrase
MSKDLIEILKEKRSNLSPSTLYSYSSTLRSLHKRVFQDEDFNVDNFSKVEQIMEDLEKKSPSIRKTTLAILYVLTERPEYKTQMDDDIKTYKEDTEKQEMTEKQKENFVSQEEIKAKFKELERDAKTLYKKSALSTKDRQEIQNYIILALCSGVIQGLPPRRSLDYINMRIRNITDLDNTMDKGKFIFRRYKGSEKKGVQQIAIPKPLQTILNKWISVNDTDWLLHDVKGEQLSSTKLTQRLNKIFNKKFSINGLRHSFLSHEFQATIEEAKKMEETMKQMGSSIDQSKIYINKL